ncbi:MAG: hypothetical protein AAB600_01480 [Patescibacteria group bacterium]
MNKWFVTWNRPNYFEWAKANKNGYRLLVIHPESDGRYLAVDAQLEMLPQGLPKFTVTEQKYIGDLKSAKQQVAEWQNK